MVIFPKLSSAAMIPLYQPKNNYLMVIVHKYKMIPFDKLVNLVRLAKSRYYMVISPKLSLDTLGVPNDLTGQFGQIG